MADENKKREYVWPVELRENKVTGRADDYAAFVKSFNNTKTLETIAREIVDERTEYREDTILNILKLVEEKIRQSLCSGHPVMTENLRIAPAVAGSFDSHGELLGGSGMKCGVNVTASRILKDEMAGVKLHVLGVQELGGAKIDRVKDLVTGKIDGTVTPGGMVELTGMKIKCVNRDGSGIGRFSLYDEGGSPEEVAAPGINDPSRIIFTLPSGLAPGSYRLEIETYFTSGTKLLKEPRTLACPVMLRVEG